MTTNMNNTESTTVSTTPTNNSGYETPPAEITSDVDDFGYGETTPPAPAAAVPPPPPVPAKVDDVKPVSGYGETPPPPPPAVVPPVVPPAETPPENPAKTDEEKLKEEVTTIVKALPDSFDKEKVQKFAEDNNFTPAQLTAYAKLVGEQNAANKASQEAFIVKQRAEWDNELRTDPEFGGENFAKNLMDAEKTLNYMPGMKKALTERGSMLPPYIMKDLLALHKVLNPVAPMVNGEPTAIEDTGSNFIEDMYK